jgi:hypothetical protein
MAALMVVVLSIVVVIMINTGWNIPVIALTTIIPVKVRILVVVAAAVNKLPTSLC